MKSQNEVNLTKILEGLEISTDEEVKSLLEKYKNEFERKMKEYWFDESEVEG